MSKRAQVEMAGLVVVVILLTLGMLFLAQFALRDDAAKKIFTRKGLAYSTMSAMMKTTISDPECVAQLRAEIYPQLEKDLLEDCALYADTSPGGYSLYTCGGKHSCIYVRQQLAQFLDQVLWHKNYEFSSRLLRSDHPVELVSIKKNAGCPATRERDASDAFFLNTEAGLVESILYLCE